MKFLTLSLVSMPNHNKSILKGFNQIIYNSDKHISIQTMGGDVKHICFNRTPWLSKCFLKTSLVDCCLEIISFIMATTRMWGEQILNHVPQTQQSKGFLYGIMHT
ncbi:hypothetical protein GQ457_16G023420 [Hibiscus cannabinus]